MKPTDRDTWIHALRKGLLNWYPFVPGKSALLLGNDVELFKEVLKDYFSSVQTSSIDVFQNNRDSEVCYDYVIALDVFENAPKKTSEWLRLIYDALQPDGVLLCGFRNRFGLKYFCGGLDEDIQAPFEGIARNADALVHLYGRHEMDELAENVGFRNCIYYYPMPDADFPQAIFTDDYLPKGSIRDRVFPYDPYNSPFLLSESDLYDDFVREKMLGVHANYCLGEYRKKDSAAKSQTHVIYAALSADRGDAHGFVTALYSDDTALKKNIAPEGRKSLAEQIENLNDIQRHGILTVEAQLTARGIEMPLVREEPLLVHLQKLLHESPQAFLDVFGLIYSDLLLSSEKSSRLNPEFSNIFGDNNSNLGPVLKKAYIDMIPYNAFWSDGRIRYYDQEFAVEDCPALYVLFRALHYTWIHIKEAESILPLEQVKARFGLTELWDGFLQRESAFVADNRNYDALAQIYQWANIDRQKITERRIALIPEANSNLALLRDVHAVQLMLLKKLDRVCEAHQLQYMAIHGTLLGAVRHHGFIPWDDDVDIAMPRADYDRLLELGAEAFDSPYFLQTPLNNYGCYYGGYAKLRFSGTGALEPRHQDRHGALNCHEGIWIDIFPIDRVPDSESSRQRLQKKLNFLQRIIFAKTYPLRTGLIVDVPDSLISLYYLLAKCTRRQDLSRLIDRLCLRPRKSSLSGILACYYGSRKNRNVWGTERIEETERVQFEDMSIPVPVGWDDILRMRYGADYMTPPPESCRWRHQDITFYPNIERIIHEDF